MRTQCKSPTFPRCSDGENAPRGPTCLGVGRLAAKWRSPAFLASPRYLRFQTGPRLFSASSRTPPRSTDERGVGASEAFRHPPPPQWVLSLWVWPPWLRGCPPPVSTVCTPSSHPQDADDASSPPPVWGPQRPPRSRPMSRAAVPGLPTWALGPVHHYSNVLASPLLPFAGPAETREGPTPTSRQPSRLSLQRAHHLFNEEGETCWFVCFNKNEDVACSG